MLNNSQYTIIIQYISILGGGLLPPPPGSYAYVCVSLCYWCPVSSASELMDKCEETRNIDYIIQANSFRRTVEIRKKKLKDCESKLG